MKWVFGLALMLCLLVFPVSVSEGALVAEFTLNEDGHATDSITFSASDLLIIKMIKMFPETQPVVWDMWFAEEFTSHNDTQLHKQLTARFQDSLEYPGAYELYRYVFSTFANRPYVNPKQDSSTVSFRHGTFHSDYYYVDRYPSVFFLGDEVYRQPEVSKQFPEGWSFAMRRFATLPGEIIATNGVIMDDGSIRYTIGIDQMKYGDTFFVHTRVFHNRNRMLTVFLTSVLIVVATFHLYGVGMLVQKVSQNERVASQR